MRRPVLAAPVVRVLTATSMAAGLVAGAAVPASASPATGTGAESAHLAAPAPARPSPGPAPLTPAKLPAPGSPTPAPPPATPASIPANVTATAFVVADAATGRVIAERAPHQRLRPASTLKVLTALALMPRLDPGAVHVSLATDLAALNSDEPGASAVGVRPGLSYRVSDLWNGVFLRSGNDAIATLAHIAGGVPQTLQLMRDTARRLHANDTVVVNADGYDADGQVSTAYDLALMARAGLQDPGFRTYCGLSRARFPGMNNTTYEIDNENKLLGHYPGMIGVKNGYTSLAHHTFVGAAERGGRTLIVTVMDAGPDSYTQTASLLDWAFAQNPGPAVDQLVAADPMARSPAPGQSATVAAGGQTAQLSQSQNPGSEGGQAGTATPSPADAGQGSDPHAGTGHRVSDQHPAVALTADRTTFSGTARIVLVAFGGFLAVVFLAVVALRLRVLRRRRLGRP